MPETVLRHVRVKLGYSEPGLRSEEHALVDMVLDDQDRVVGKWELHGRWVYEDEANPGRLITYPMIVRVDGEVYFDPEESISTNLRDRVMRVGELCTFWNDDSRGQGGGDEWPYRVLSVAVLGQPSR